tara:strand:- start:4 stop:507 length:504 start_codon:yes stop_codon:yes gene_type:complete
MSSKLGVENIAHTNGTNAMTISSGGVATLPQIPCCYVKLTTSNAQDSSNPYITYNTDIRFDNIILNRGSCYSESTGRFTVPIAGIYEAKFIFLSNGSTTTDHSIILKKNNVTVSHGYNGVDNQHVPITTFYLGECVVNDYFTVQLTGGQIFINTSGEYSAFSVKLVG